MKDLIGNATDLVPSAVPTDEDIRQWEALPREEQLRRLRQALTQSDCNTPSPRSMDEILATARARASSSG